MLTKIWHRLRGSVSDEHAPVDEELVRRELQAFAAAPELEPLAAARGDRLTHVRGAFIETDLPALPGTLISGLEMIGLTIEFAGRPPLHLKVTATGEGLAPCDVEGISWKGVETRNLNELEPFAGVVGTRLRQLTLLSYHPHDVHVGIRLQFEGGELVFLNLWDDIETYDGLVPEVLEPQSGGRRYVRVYEYPYDSER